MERPRSFGAETTSSIFLARLYFGAMPNDCIDIA
jgi:hypothetical protein